MNSRRHFYLTLGLILSGFASAVLAAPQYFRLSERMSMHESSSGIKGPTYEAIVADLKGLESEYPKWVELIEYGKSVKGRPLVGVRIWDHQSNLAGRKTVVITGATHGDEYLGFEDKLARYFLKNSASLPGVSQFFRSGGVLIVVPILNPDGYSAHQRWNANSLDLNRDFPLKQFPGKTEPSQPETRAIAQMVVSSMKQQSSVLSVSMDYHCCIGAMLYPYSYSRPSPPSVPPANLGAFKGIGELMKTVFRGKYPYGTTPDILGYDAVGTTKDFYYESFNASSFTFEGEGQGADKLEAHAQLWNAILGSVSKTAAEWWLVKH